jgi:hypothetical protein
LTPLHGGHVALCAVSGMLNGIFGSGERRHIAVWQPVKVVDRFEERKKMALSFSQNVRDSSMS